MKAMKAMKVVKADALTSMKAMKAIKKKAISQMQSAAQKVKKAKTQDKEAEQEKELTTKRTQELKAMSKDDLKGLSSKLGLEAGIKKDMVEKLLAHEARVRQEARERKARAQEILAEKKKELEGKSASELKELCAQKGLKLGGGKEDRLERLLANFEEEGGVESLLKEQDVAQRRNALGSLATADLFQMCNTSGIDPFVKDIMVERILQHELFAKGGSALIPVLMKK